MLNNPSFQRTLDVHQLYQQIQQLQQENAQLKAQLEPGKYFLSHSLENLEIVHTLTQIIPVPISLSQIADGKILSANPLFISSFGLSVWAIQNYAISEFYANPTQYQNLINQVCQSRKVENQEFDLKRRDGTVFRATISVQLLSFDPEPAVLTVFHDLSKYQQAEQTLQQQTLSLRRQSLAMRDLSHYNTLHSRDLTAVVRKITETASHTLNVDRVSVWLHPILQQSLLNPDGFTHWLKTAPISASPWSNILNLKFVCLDRYERQSNNHWIDQQQPIPPSHPFPEAILTQHLIHTALPQSDSVLLNETPSQSLQLPIRLAEETIGMLWIETDDLTHHWTIEEQTFAEFLANFVALSLEQFERQLTEAALSQVKQQLEVQVEKRTQELKQAVQQLRDEMVERIKTESALERALDAAQAASRVKSTFITNMSHEFRTPLHIILGYADMLYEEATEQQLTDVVPDVQQIRQAGQKLLHMIDNILDLAKIEADKITLHSGPFDLHLVVNELLTQVSVIAEQNQNQLIVDFQTTVKLICTDVNKLRHILLNLLDNALKFTHQGQVYLTISQTQRHNKDWICFQVRDTGIGIATDTQQNLFQPFTQVDPSISRSYGGMGLGLTLSHHLCKLMEGEMTVSSQLGSGSTFTVYLPLNPCPP